MIDALRALADDPGATAILADFDGSLSSIVDHPDDAVPVGGAVATLRRLTQRFARVGIVSGRPVEFLRRVLPVDGLELVGQYGLERWNADRACVEVDEAAAPYAAAVAAVAAAADAVLPDVFVERKGTVAVTLHWRMRPEVGADAEAWAARQADALGLTRYPTRMAVELRPPVPVDKGRGVERLARGTRRALFAGDDHGDLSGFDALDRLVADGSLASAVRIAVRSSEEPPELVARADVHVDGPDALVALLSALVA